MSGKRPILAHTIRCSATLNATVAEIWAVWEDLPASPRWDLREQDVRLDGPFQTGTTGWSTQVGGRPGGPFTLTLVQPMARWVRELPLPGGRLVIDHRVESTGRREVLVAKDYTAHGPFAIVFAVVLAGGIRRSAALSFAALEAEAWRRARSM